MNVATADNAEIVVDILMSTYNGEVYLPQQIESLFGQSHKNWRLWIRDDGSTDNTVEILEKKKKMDDRIISIAGGDINIGPSNSFAMLTNGLPEDAVYVMYCDQDDVWHTDKISKTLVKMLETETEDQDMPVLVHSDLVVVDNDLKTIASSFWKYQGLNSNCVTINWLMMQNNVTGCALMMNKALVEKVGSIPEGVIMHDWWCALVCSAFGKIAIVNEPLINYRQHSSNDTGAHEYSIAYIVFTFIEYLQIKNGDKCREGVRRTVNQVRLFKHRYGHSLDEKKFNLIDGYEKLWDYSALQRKMFLIKNKVLKQGWVRNLGLLFFV